MTEAQNHGYIMVFRTTSNEGEKMELIKYANNCRKIFEHYGIVEQRKQLIQECAELITALTKLDRQNIIEEMADVQVMLDQFSINLPGVGKEIEQIKRQKVERQLKRIESEEG